MERVILVLALLAGLHLILSFLHCAGMAFNNLLERLAEPTATPDRVEETSADWRQYDRPACRRRHGTGTDSARNGEASFEVIA